LEKHFNHCSLSDENLDPDKWLSKLDNLRIRLKIDHKYEIYDYKVITQILYNAPSKHYATMVAVLKLEMAKGKLDLEVIKQAFRTIYGTIKQKGGTRKKSSLINRTGNNHFKKQLKGGCRTCGKKGHK
jgi:hypothetical protein